MTLYVIDCRKDAIQHISLQNFINEVSNLLADNSDYEDYLKPKLEKLLKYVNQ